MASPHINPKYVVATNRLEKATKIDCVLRDFFGHEIEGRAILDVGVGTGEIIDFFAAKNRTYGVDIDDQRTSRLSSFQHVKSEKLPFDDAMFDAVISNHVIEHVTSPQAHLLEIARVLKPGGTVYLATPNRLYPKETHFKLWLIHYLPAHIYFRLAAKFGRKGERFWIFTPGGLKKLIKASGFSIKDYTPLILADPARFHAQNMCPIALGKVPARVVSYISPTFIHVLTKTK